MDNAELYRCRSLLDRADSVLIGAGAGLTAVAGLDYTDYDAFSRYFPAWKKRGFTMQSELVGYQDWLPTEQWGYLTTHLEYVYYSQKRNRLYEELRNIVGERDYFVLTSNVEELFRKNGFDADRIYTPQGCYGKLQCTVPCREIVWDARPYHEELKTAMDPVSQTIVDDSAVPVCPYCGAPAFLNVRVDASMVDAPYRPQWAALTTWLNNLDGKNLLVLELGSGFNTPTVVRMPMEQVTCQLEHSHFIRVNKMHSQVPAAIRNQSVSIGGDIGDFVYQMGGHL